MITGFHHLVLFCTDTERSREWYERVGFEYERSYGGMHWFRAGPGEIMLHPSSIGSDGNAPHIHFATSDVDAMFGQAIARCLQPLDHQQPGVALDEPVSRPWGAREFELEDPDGHRIILTQA
jgi:catechol 2,3-dioxygenase-like lactoylglutathione lyase family enzyme